VALLVPLLEQWYIKTEALSFLYDYDVMVIISINFRTGNTVSLLTFFIGENTEFDLSTVQLFGGWIGNKYNSF